MLWGILFFSQHSWGELSCFLCVKELCHLPNDQSLLFVQHVRVSYRSFFCPWVDTFDTVSCSDISFLSFAYISWGSLNHRGSIHTRNRTMFHERVFHLSPLSTSQLSVLVTSTVWSIEVQSVPELIRVWYECSFSWLYFFEYVLEKLHVQHQKVEDTFWRVELWQICFDQYERLWNIYYILLPKES